MMKDWGMGMTWEEIEQSIGVDGDEFTAWCRDSMLTKIAHQLDHAAAVDLAFATYNAHNPSDRHVERPHPEDLEATLKGLRPDVAAYLWGKLAAPSRQGIVPGWLRRVA